MKAPNRPHVLYVEDDEDSCQLMTILLEMSGIDITCIQGSRNALILSRKERFDLFLLDLWLHDGDGNDLCMKLRNAFPNIPVVFYTGCATEAEKRHGLLSGAAAYLVKPHSDLVAPTILRLVDHGRSDARTETVKILMRDSLRLELRLPGDLN